MAVIEDYTTLQTAISDYLARSDLSTFIPNFIQNWEERFFRQPRNWGNWMEAELNITIANQVAVLPVDYLGARAVYIDGNPGWALQSLTAAQLLERFPRGNGASRPSHFARNRTDFIFGPEPDSNYVVKGTYYAKPALIRDDADGVNWFITNAPDLALYGALLEAEVFLKNDKRLSLWQAKHDESLKDYRDMMKATSYSGGMAGVVLA